MEENPFLQDEEEEQKEKEKDDKCNNNLPDNYIIRKPYQKEQITEAQKARNFKGLKMMKEAIKKAIPFRYQK